MNGPLSLAMLVCLGATFCNSQTGNPEKTPCDQVKTAHVYSNARYVEESGDVIGLELALFEDGRALLFDFEGGLWGEPFEFKFNKGATKVTGIQTQHLVEYPSKKTVIQINKAVLEGRVVNTTFVGSLLIGEGTPEHFRLKRVRHLWGCK